VHETMGRHQGEHPHQQTIGVRRRNDYNEIGGAEATCCTPATLPTRTKLPKEAIAIKT
jgi:hypothetical protein